MGLGFLSKWKKKRTGETESCEDNSKRAAPVELTPRKVLIVTTLDDLTGENLNAVNWYGLDKVTNIRDYDDVILDLWDFPEVKNEMFPKYEEIDIQVWRIYDRLFTQQITAEFLHQGGRIIIVGNPAFTRPGPGMGGTGSVGNRIFGPSLPYSTIEWDTAIGSRHDLTDLAQEAGLQAYLNRIQEYNYAFQKFGHWTEFHDSPHPDELWKVSPFATTRVGKPISFGLLHRKLNIQQHQKLGHFFFLPTVNLPHFEAMLMLLKDFLGVAVSQDSEEPVWATEIRMPDEDGIDHEIESVQLEIASLEKKLEELGSHRLVVREPLRLLFADGPEFESTVRDALCELGALVVEPLTPNKEDGWISIEINGKLFEGVLEIKGTANTSYGARGIRQLGEWIQRGKNDGKELKPIFIGNNQRLEAPKLRQHPVSKDLNDTIEQFGAVVLRAELLFEALVLLRKGQLDHDHFWQSLFASVGVFNFDKID